MTDPIIARFAEACGATAPLHLRVDLPEVTEGNRRTEGMVAMPFTLVGRDDACDVTLTDPDVNPRHAWLQVVGGRVLAVDLGSRIGLSWPGQGTGSGWLDVGVPMGIGPFLIRLCSPVSQKSIPFAPRYSPLQSDPAISQSGSTFTLEFRNGKRARDRWTVNRLITLVGRASECKIRLSAEDIAAYHCGLVLAGSSLWVVDLSGRGVVVDGERMRVSPLKPGAELWIGRFLIGLHDTSSESVATTGRVQPKPSPDVPPAGSPGYQTVPAEDEVPVGVAPSRDPHAGLPSSHIMADAFQVWGAGTAGGPSNPILVSASGSSPLILPVAPAARLLSNQNPKPPVVASVPHEAIRCVSSADRVRLDAVAAATVASLLRQLGDLHGQILTQFEQSLGLMVRLFACLNADQLPAMQQELARIQELNSELGRLQAELAQRATDKTPTSSSPLRGAQSPPSPPIGTDSTALHDWVADRISLLQKEHQARWQSLVGMFAAAEHPI